MEERSLPKQLPSLRTSTAPTANMNMNMNMNMNVSPSRSRTDPPAPEQQQHDKSHLHRRLHSGSLRHRAFTSSRHHHHHGAKDTVQSALELKPPISFDQLLRRDKKTADPARRGSNTPHASQQYESAREWSAQQPRKTEERKVNPRDVRKAKQENARREEELRQSLKVVEETAMASTRQLDDTYYSILEKASLLRSVVASLQQLADESRRMHASFQSDSTKLEDETKKNLATFDNFSEQEKNINLLVERLKDSKSQTDRLNERLEACRNRVEAFEQRENEKAKKRRKQWGVAWCMVIAFVVLIIAVIVVKKRSTVGSKLHHVARMLDAVGNEVASPITAALKPTASPSEDPYLRKLFDEL